MSLAARSNVRRVLVELGAAPGSASPRGAGESGEDGTAGLLSADACEDETARSRPNFVSLRAWAAGMADAALPVPVRRCAGARERASWEPKLGERAKKFRARARSTQRSAQDSEDPHGPPECVARGRDLPQRELAGVFAWLDTHENAGTFETIDESGGLQAPCARPTIATARRVRAGA